MAFKILFTKYICQIILWQKLPKSLVYKIIFLQKIAKKPYLHKLTP